MLNLSYICCLTTLIQFYCNQTDQSIVYRFLFLKVLRLGTLMLILWILWQPLRGAFFLYPLSSILCRIVNQQHRRFKSGNRLSYSDTLQLPIRLPCEQLTGASRYEPYSIN